MTPTVVGALSGAILAVSALVFGFWGFLLVAVLMGAGALIGRIVSGKLDIRGLADAFTGRRTS
ncbi:MULTISPECIES: DUF2273 domain-containing protein [unclassified Microbacterium]|jgi:uncharacterized membrane protein|uniref:DUF2273 domain-containing protein n=1 Tax=unclassified Microbacterium TaxID=2609290 RepID=UPI00042933DE|nr:MULTISPECIES: DUF2273 domain-containing protein [unclassified Microbacterium]PQZ54319.1 DUF2273 domain-containing protein [Microbacterium sp. MYb43]PQZ75403.1 DUF2273 domain-containing protein [Microbacterium sp. MYb40]PRB19557.1 DUF2273 domain-containing protein [Microbacterium sp. MYb54]PRB25754.1 DUF2273 domain-containing protein [Microbacterium sp. MYb50]PRB64237.1 DUF2273 domain-containing protein [Microbacterium sp. MYb24]